MDMIKHFEKITLLKINLKTYKLHGTVTDVPLILKSDGYFIKHKRPKYPNIKE